MFSYIKSLFIKESEILFSPELSIIRIEDTDSPYYSIGGLGGDILSENIRLKIPSKNVSTLKLKMDFTQHEEHKNDPFLYGKVGIDVVYFDHTTKYYDLFKQKIALDSADKEVKLEAKELIEQSWEETFADALGEMQDQEIGNPNSKNASNQLNKTKFLNLNTLCILIFIIVVSCFAFFKFYHKGTQNNEMSLNNTTQNVFNQALQEELKKQSDNSSTAQPDGQTISNSQSADDEALSTFGLKKGISLDEKNK